MLRHGHRYSGKSSWTVAHERYLATVKFISEHPASRVGELTPRLWKQLFAANPLRSEIHDFPA
jgi:hypothetical protein